jgi:hypothetical protein
MPGAGSRSSALPLARRWKPVPGRLARRPGAGGRGGRPAPLRFRPNGRFVIVQFTDLHWHNGEDEDLQTRRLMERVLEAEQPDLAAVTGDVLEGRRCRDPAESWRQAVRPLEERGVPWAAVFGNHDDEGSLDRAALMAVQQGCRMCRTRPGPAAVSGLGNYVLQIQAAARPALAAVLYFLDSGSYAPEGIGRYDWIKRDQIAWYLATARRLAGRWVAQPAGGPPHPLPALAFFHIPLPEYDEMWDYHPCRGSKYEGVYCPALNTGFFAALRETGDVMGTFVGHDHVNDFEGTLHGIRLCYGRAGGYQTYGREGFPRGARVIELREGERGFATWMRLEDGSALRDPPEHAPEGRRTMSGE